MTLQRYVLTQFLLALAFAVSGIFFVLLPGILVNAVHKVGSAGLVALVGYLPLVLAELVPYIVPLGYLLAVVTTFGRMVVDREWTAVRMAGIYPGKLLLPCALVAVGLGFGTDWLASTLAPSWKYEQNNYKSAVIKNVVKRLAPGRTELRIPGFFLKAARRDPENPIFYDAHISILQEDEKGVRRDIWLYADSVAFELLEGNVLRVYLKKPRLIKGEYEVTREEATIDLNLDQLLRHPAKDPNRPHYLSSSEMRRRIEAGTVQGPDRAEYVYEIHRRHALAGTYLLFLLLGFPTGIKLRSGTQLGAFAAAVAYAIAYYVLSLRVADQLYTSGVLGPALAPWITNAVGVLIGCFFTWKVLRE